MLCEVHSLEQIQYMHLQMLKHCDKHKAESRLDGRLDGREPEVILNLLLGVGMAQLPGGYQLLHVSLVPLHLTPQSPRLLLQPSHLTAQQCIPARPCIQAPS